MKKRFLASLMMLTLLLTTSCDKDIEYDYANHYTYATVTENTIYYGDSQADAKLAFKLDSGMTFLVVENKYSLDYTLVDVGDRLVIGVTLMNSEDDAYDYYAKLYDVTGVEMGYCDTVIDEASSDAIPFDELTYVNTSAMLSYGYFSVLIGFETDNIGGVSYALVSNQTDGVNGGDYLELELRVDLASSGSTTNTGTYERYVSFDLTPFAELLENRSGVDLVVKTISGGLQAVYIDNQY